RGVVRVEMTADNINSKFDTNMTLPGALRKVRFEWSEAKGEISAEGVVVRFAKNPFSLEFLNAAGKSLLKMKPDGIDWSEDGAYGLRFERGAGDRYFGLGEPLPTPAGQKITLDYSGRKRTIWNRHLPPADLGLPFLMNPRGYALLVDNSYKAEFDFSKPGEASYSATGGPLRFYFFSDPSMLNTLDTYTRITGRTPMPPAWVAGYMQSRYGYYDAGDFRWLMDNFRSRRIPCDAFVFDLYWFGQGGMGNLKWNEAAFPNPSAFTDEMHRRGFKSIVIVEPQIMGSSINFTEARLKKIVARDEKKQAATFEFWGRPSYLVDFLNPAAREWYSKKIRDIHETGVDAWWTDLNEPEIDTDEMVFHGGTRRNAVHNIQALFMHKGMSDMYRKDFPNERLFIMSRSGFIGDWRYGSNVWTGDVNASWDHLKNQLYSGLSLMTSGYGIWNSDIGGFHGHPAPELFTRWMQFGAFNPIFRAHGHHNLREPWEFGETAERNLRSLINLRYRLSPYLYTMFHELNAYGRPTMRPMFLEFQSEPRAFDEVSEFMYGKWLLVAPVTAPGARSRSVWLPKGKWTDFNTEKIYTGPADVNIDAPLGRIPLLVREGAVIPMAPLMQFIGEKPLDPLTLHVYPGSAASYYDVYEDDGKSNDYEQGGYAITPVELSPRGKNIRVRVGDREGGYAGMPESRGCTVVVHGAARPAKVLLNGDSVRPGSASESTPAWSYNTLQRTLKVSVPRTAVGFTLDISVN
ncbi:MAG TPA: glycoside hydrolase family 31 protein, partial [bacterium]|nr:glycoside hydrolase family 31 protein [bacterium]